MQAFLDHGADFVSADTLRELVDGMNKLTGGEPHLDARPGEARGVATGPQRPRNPFGKDPQLIAIRGARRVHRATG